MLGTFHLAIAWNTLFSFFHCDICDGVTQFMPNRLQQLNIEEKTKKKYVSEKATNTYKNTEREINESEMCQTRSHPQRI